MRVPCWIFAWAVATTGCGGYDGSPLCDRDELVDALAEAEPSDTVRIGSCSVRGGLVVPAGVTLAGEGPGSSFVTGDGGDAIRLETTRGTTTTLRGVRVDTSAGFGVNARGDGAATIEDVEVHVDPIGAGVVARNLAILSMTGVVVDGPIDDAATAEMQAIDGDPDSAASHGVAITDVETATINDLRVSGFSRFGVQVRTTRLIWAGGSVRQTAGTGLMVLGGASTIGAVSVTEVWQAGTLLPSIGALFAAGAEVGTTSLTVSDNARLGLVHSETSLVDHTDLVATGNQDVGVWTQLALGPTTLRGAATDLSGNHVAGFVAVDSPGLSILDGRIDDTIAGPHFYRGAAGSPMVADGLLLVTSTDGTRIEGVDLGNNAEAQIKVVLDGGDTRGLTFADVTVNGTGEQLGAVGFGGTLVPGWDEGITRLGATAANDALFDPSGALAPFGAMNPCQLPVSDDGL